MGAKNLLDSGFLYTDRRTFNLDRNDDIHYLYKEVTPFLGWLTDKRAEEVDDPDFKLFEDQGSWRYQRLSVNGAPSSWSNSGGPGETVSVDVDGVTGLSVDDSLLGVQFAMWDENKENYKGNAIVNSVTDSDTIVLKVLGNPENASEQAVDLADNDVLEVASHDWGEGKTAPEAKSDELRGVRNSCGITRTAVEVTGTLYKTSLRATRGGEFSSELDRLRRNKMKEHKLRLEKKYLLSWRTGGIGGTAHGAGGGTDSTFINHQSDKDGNTVRTTAGFIPIMKRYGRTSGDYQNVFNFNKADMTQTDLVEMGEKIFQYANGVTRKAFCGPSAMSYWQTMANAKASNWDINISPAEVDKYGSRIRYLDLGHGVYELTVLQSLRGTGYDNVMLVPHEDHIERKYFRPDSYETNIKTDNNYDGIKDEWFSDDGICMTQIDAHSMVTLN